MTPQRHCNTCSHFCTLFHSTWDHLIVFNFSHIPANVMLANAAIQVMCTDLEKKKKIRFSWCFSFGKGTLVHLHFYRHLNYSPIFYFAFFPLRFSPALLLFMGLLKNKNSEFFPTQKNQCLMLERAFTNAVQCCCWEQPPIATSSSKAKIASPHTTALLLDWHVNPLEGV